MVSDIQILYKDSSGVDKNQNKLLNDIQYYKEKNKSDQYYSGVSIIVTKGPEN